MGLLPQKKQGERKPVQKESWTSFRKTEDHIFFFNLKLYVESFRRYHQQSKLSAKFEGSR